ncbi:MAG: hypothetical protein ACRDGA_07215, partial [Bacteroidota bacterium]
MSKYTIKKSITSCSVSIEFVKNIERYILSTVQKDGATSKENTNNDYTFKISDDYGEEVFNTIEKYDRSFFPDSIKSISLRYRSWQNSIQELGLT